MIGGNLRRALNSAGYEVSLLKEEEEKILQIFQENKVSYQLYEHQPVYTSQEAAKVRGVELKTGCKSMVLKRKDGKFILANIAADKKIDFKKFFLTRSQILPVAFPVLREIETDVFFFFAYPETHGLIDKSCKDVGNDEGKDHHNNCPGQVCRELMDISFEET